MLKELVEYVVRKLVDSPDDVYVSEEKRGNVIVVHVRVAKDDLGKVIGKEGRVARSVRTLIYAAAIKMGCRASLEIEK